MSIYIGFSEFEEGQDPVGDWLMKEALKKYPEKARQFPYPHCYLVCGTPELGYHRSEMFTAGLGYVWYPPGGETFQDGPIFKFDAPEFELAAMYRVLDPWTRNEARSTLRHMVRMLRGEVYVWPEIKRGFFSCTTFVLWAVGLLSFPHRPPELIDFLRESTGTFKEIDYAQSKETTQEGLLNSEGIPSESHRTGYRWV